MLKACNQIAQKKDVKEYVAAYIDKKGEIAVNRAFLKEKIMSNILKNGFGGRRKVFS